ncbi:hypothetical protein Q7P37_008893 [Cladosporium fusiforme]
MAARVQRRKVGGQQWAGSVGVEAASAIVGCSSSSQQAGMDGLMGSCDQRSSGTLVCRANEQARWRTVGPARRCVTGGSKGDHAPTTQQATKPAASSPPSPPSGQRVRGMRIPTGSLAHQRPLCPSRLAARTLAEAPSARRSRSPPQAHTQRAEADSQTLSLPCLRAHRARQLSHVGPRPAVMSAASHRLAHHGTAP